MATAPLSPAALAALTPSRLTHRVAVRLTPSDVATIQGLASAVGSTPSETTRVLIRLGLTHLPQEVA